VTGTPGRPGLAGQPVNLLVRGRRVVVVGAGRIAARKTEPLLDLGADVVVVSPAVGDEITAWADQARRIWVNSADDPDNCSFTLMSVIRRSDLVIAIGTGGRSPALAAHLRRVFDEELGPEYETLLDLLSEARESLRAAGRSSEHADWPQAFASGIVDLVRDGRVDEARELLNRCL